MLAFTAPKVLRYVQSVFPLESQSATSLIDIPSFVIDLASILH